MRPGGVLLQPEGPSHLLGVYPGCLLAPQRPAAVHVGPEVCWSEHQPEVGLPGQKALKSGEQRYNRIYQTVSHYQLTKGMAWADK